MHKIYVDVPYNYDYVYHGESSGPEVLTRDFGAQFVFICNAAQRVKNASGLGIVGNRGDAHLVWLESEEDELFFLIKTGFTKLNTDVVGSYINEKRDKERFIL
jgi:hypothetical protein